MEVTYYILFLCCTAVFAEVSITSNDESHTDAHPFTKIGLKYYLINNGTKMNWFEAAHFCRTYDSDLATIESEAELNALTPFLSPDAHTIQYFWTSGNDLAVEGKFMSLSNGRPITYSKWLAGEPNNSTSNDDCVQLKSTGIVFYMNDHTCDVEAYSICEKQSPSKCCTREKFTDITPKCASEKLLKFSTQTAAANKE